MNHHDSIAELLNECSNLVIRAPAVDEYSALKIALATVNLHAVFMNRQFRFALLLIVSIAAGVGVWAALRYTAPQRFWRRPEINTESAPVNYNDSERWTQAIEKVKEERTAVVGDAPLDVPPELRHYEDRHWFLATQVAEVKKQNLQTSQDFLDVAAMISRNELAPVPVVTDDYVLLGVGAKADESAFTRYEDDHSVGVYDEAELSAAYQRLANERQQLQDSVTQLQKQLASLKSRDRGKRADLQKQLNEQEHELASLDEDKAALDQSYGQPQEREKLFSDYKSLQTLAKDFRGRTYDLTTGTDRQGLKIAMLSSLRPAALKILEEVAAAYRKQFDRPLPVSSLVRPEEYQHMLRRYNRAATTIDTPPHSTGLAFDIDYRFMSIPEQNFVMNELASLKRDGRIEVLRERGANFHVFAFVDGVRPGDDLITASLDEVGGSLPDDTEEANDKSSKANAKAPGKSNASHRRSKPAKQTRKTTHNKARRRRG